MNKIVGWRSVWTLYPASNLRHGLIRPLFFCIPLMIALLLSTKGSYLCVGIISSMITTSFPSIIGFILAGYAILIGCSNSDLIRELCKKDHNKDSSIFQRTSATFAIVMGMLIMTFLLGFCTNFVFTADCKFLFNKGVRVFNYSIAFTLLYMSTYSIWSLIDITINIFNYSQFINYQNANIKTDTNEGYMLKLKRWISKFF